MCSYIFVWERCAIVLLCYLVLWWDFHKWSSIFPDLIFAQFVKLFGDYFSTISISFTYSVLMYYFFKSGGTIYKFHLLQKCMKLNKWFIPFFRSYCLNWWKTRSNTLMASNFGNNKLSLFVSWASFDVCMDIPLGETLFIKNIYLRITWRK